MNYASTERPWAGWSALLGALALGGCATPAVSRQEVDSLRAEVRSLQDQQRDQQREIARLRTEVKAQQGMAPSASGAPAEKSSPRATLKAAPPALAVASVDEVSTFAIPANLRVVKLEPDAVEFNDENTPQATGAAARSHHLPAAPIASLPTDTSLKEPVLSDLSPQPVPDPAMLDVQYKVALTAPNALDQLEAFARAHPEHPSADNALFEAGLRAEKAGEAGRAAKDFERAVREYPAGDMVADSLLHLAACDLTLNKTGAARQALQQLSTQYPDSAQAEAARVRLADLPH